MRHVERLLFLAVAVGGIVYGERLLHIHGLVFSGSALGFVQAGVAVASILFGVVPGILSVFAPRRARASLVAGELVAALLLLGASQHVLRQSVHVNIVGTGTSRVLALSASTPMEAIE